MRERLRFKEFPFSFFGNDLGLTLICLSNGRIVLERTPMFVPTYDYCTGGINACLDHNDFSLMGPDGKFMLFNYGTDYPYKEMPVLKQWLQQQNLRFDLIA